MTTVNCPPRQLFTACCPPSAVHWPLSTASYPLSLDDGLSPTALWSRFAEPSDGRVDRVPGSKRDGSHGVPSGIVGESVLALVWPLVKKTWTAEHALITGMQHAVDNGLTAVHPNDAASFAIYKVRWCCCRRCWRCWRCWRCCC